MSELAFAESGILAIIAGVVLLGLLRWLWGRAITTGQARLGARQHSPLGRHHRGLSRARLLLLLGGLSLVVVALARPRWGYAEEERTSRGFNVAVVIDCSRSMEATDLYPNRSQAARLKALDLLRLEPQARVALIPFAASAVLRCPLTGDQDALRLMLEDCDPGLFDGSHQGTAIGKGVDLAVRTLAGRADRAQAVLVLSDGDDPDAEAVTAAAELARSEGIPVYGILVADPDRTATIRLNGQDQEVGASAETLDELVLATGGIRVSATTDTTDVETVVIHLRDHLDSLSWQNRRRTVQRERFQWPLLPAIACLFIACLLPTRRSHRRSSAP